MTRTTGLIIAGLVLALIVAVSFFVDTAEAGCKKHPKHCYPQPTPTATVVATPTATATSTPTQTPVPTTTPVPDDDIDTCFYHPTNPCVEPTPTPTVVVVEPTPAPTPDVVETATPTPTPVVQLPPSGVLPGAPNTGSAGLRAMVDSATPTWCYIVNDVLYCSGKYYGRIWK